MGAVAARHGGVVSLCGVAAAGTRSAGVVPTALGPGGRGRGRRRGGRGGRRCRSGRSRGRCANALCRRAQSAGRTQRAGRPEVERSPATRHGAGSAKRPGRAKGAERPCGSRVHEAGKASDRSGQARGHRGGGRSAHRTGEGERAHDGRRRNKMGWSEHGLSFCSRYRARGLLPGSAVTSMVMPCRSSPTDHRDRSLCPITNAISLSAQNGEPRLIEDPGRSRPRARPKIETPGRP